RPPGGTLMNPKAEGEGPVVLTRLLRRPGAAVALLGGAGGAVLALVLALWNKDPVARCPDPHDAIGQPLDLVFVGLCAASFLAGGLLSDVARGRDHIEGALGAPQSRSRNWLQFILVVVLAILFALLTYETGSLVLLDANSGSSLWPITWFVRCVSTLSSWSTMGSLVVVCIMCAFFGKWLWYRPRTYRPT